MGACSFVNRNSGKSMREAYDNLCQIKEDEYGHQEGYNGTISTTDGFRDVTDMYKASKKEIRAFIDEKMDGLSKRQCWGICIRKPVGNDNKIKSVVTHEVLKGTRKWELKYVVYDRDNVLSAHDTKGDAVKSARAYTEKTQKRTSIEVQKRSKSPTRVATIEYKSSTKEKDGEYVFFGWAAE